MTHLSIEYTNLAPPAHYTLAFTPFLYNQESFLELKNYSLQSFYALNHERKAVVARIHFTLQTLPNNQCKAISLPELPFGSLEYDTTLPSSMLSELVSYVKDQLREQNVASIEIRDCIPEYRPDQGTLLKKALLLHGFNVSDQQDNHHIPVDTTPFANKIHRMEAKRLRKCHSANSPFWEDPLTELTEVYRFLEYCRAERQWKLSLSLEQLQPIVNAHKDCYRLFSVFHENQRIAASLMITVHGHVVYDFYHDALQAYDRYSPTVMLLEGMYILCQQQGVRVLDMGTSTSTGVSTFKEHVGGVLSQKIIYQLIL